MIPIEGVLDFYGVEYDDAKSGNQKVLCPFHDDTVASASVNLDLGLFNCYGCPVAGDAIELLMDQEGLDFLEAKRRAEELAGDADRPLSRRPDPGNTFLPSKSGARGNRRGWRSPWGRRES